MKYLVRLSHREIEYQSVVSASQSSICEGETTVDENAEATSVGQCSTAISENATLRRTSIYPEVETENCTSDR